MAELTREEENFLKQYRAELDGIVALTDAEKESLFAQAKAGEKDAISRLAEGLMPTAMEIALEKHLPGLHIGDLIQEGNLALLEALGTLSESTAEAQVYVTEYVARAMDDYIMETGENLKGGHEIADKLNLLAEAAEKLIEELGEVTMEDVVAYTELEPDEINELLRVAGEEGLFGEEDGTDTSEKL